MAVAASQSPDGAGVTHVVFPFGPKGDPDDGKQYLRTMEVRGWLQEQGAGNEGRGGCGMPVLEQGHGVACMRLSWRR